MVRLGDFVGFFVGIFLGKGVFVFVLMDSFSGGEI